MSVTFDTTTRAAYEAATTATAKAAAVVSSLTGTIYVKVYNASNTVVGDGTMESPWATSSGDTVTIGEVTEFEVTTTGTPDSGWYIRFENSDASRWVRASFGLSSSSQDFKWSLGAWEDGQTGTIGTATIVCPGNEAPVFTAAPTTASIPAAGGTIQFTATDSDGGTLTYSLTTARSGITINSTTGLVTVTAAAAGTSGNIVVQVSDGILTASATCAVTVSASGGEAQTIKWNPGFYIYLSPSNGHRDGSTQRASDLTWFQDYASDSNIKGFYIQKYISAFETGTVADYSAGFDMVDYYLGLCATYNKRLCIEFEQIGFGSNPLPTYWQNQGWTHSYYSGFNVAANIGISACRDRLIALIQAYAARYNGHPRLEIVGLEETTTTLPSGVTSATWTSNYRTILTAAASAWSNTLFRSCENGQLGQAEQISVYNHIQSLNNTGAGCIITGGPDHEDTLTNPLDPVNEKSWKQLWRGQTTSAGSTWLDARGIHPYIGETQERGLTNPSFYQDTAANICTYQIDLMEASHVTFLNYTKWSEVYAAITARSGLTDTTPPSSLTGRTVTGGT